MITPDESVLNIDAEVQRRYDHYSQVVNISRTYSTRPPENIPTNVLSSRLKLLESSDLIKASLYQRHPPRFAYTLTDKGKKLASVIRAIADWGESVLPKSRGQRRTSSTQA